jgi:S-adenosylmethionine-diacylglycerol 3-amino-3-carboxypropyl transferase
MAYFEKLNYTLSNEDTRVEFEILKPNEAQVFAIAGSGARVLPLIAKNPKEIDVIDLAQPQLFLVELRLAAAKALDYEEYLFFIGYRGALPGGSATGDSRLSLFKRLELSEDCREFWQSNEKQWVPRGFVLLGKWENHFQKLGFLFRNVLKMNLTPIFEAQSLDEQLALYKKHFNTFIFRNFLRVVGSEFVFNKFLYKGHFSGASENRTEKRSPAEFLIAEFERLFTTTLVRKNYFLQVLFLGFIRYEEGLPLEAHRFIIDLLKKSSTKVNYLQGDLVTLLKHAPYNFISLSDTISYLSQSDASSILQKLKCPAKSHIVIRSFLKAPQEMKSEGWSEKRDLNEWALNLDGTGVYRFHIFEKQ